MPKYNVLAVRNEYFEVDADNASDAAMKAFNLFRNGELAMFNSNPEFICEECDLIEEEENA